MAINSAINGSFEKPKTCFSQISNRILRDESLSLKAKGLYSLIASYMTIPNFILFKDMLKSKSSDGRCGFDSAWKELVACGYLIHKRERLSDGTFLYRYSLKLPESGTQNTHQTDGAYDTDSENEQLQKPKLETSYKKMSTPKTKKHSSRSTNKKVESLFLSEDPLAENQSADSYIYNTKNNNTKSINHTDNQFIKKIAEIKTQIDFDYFESEFNLGNSNKLGAVKLIVEFLAQLTLDQNSCNADIAAGVDSCTIIDFFEHMKTRKPDKIVFPVPYWRKCFINFIRQSALVCSGF